MARVPRIAVIGSGIAGHGAAYRLTRAFGGEAVTLYEKDHRPGGHAATVDVDYDGNHIAVDTGFIVYNNLNYPLMTALYAELGIKTHASDMGFALSLDNGTLEWAGQERGALNGLFAQRRNLLSPRFWGMLVDILRFNARTQRDFAAGALDGLSLGDYIARLGLSTEFRENYILPMGAAIWSMPQAEMLGFPAKSFAQFFINHRLLHFTRPQWRTVTGGSREYVSTLIAASGHATRYGDSVKTVTRVENGVRVETLSGHADTYDAAIIAAHSDEALAMRPDATVEEARLLSAIRYRGNDVYLHRDARFMPKRRAAWAAWNVLRESAAPDRPLTVTYWMNRLQGIDERFPLFITLNPVEPPPAHLTFGRYHYAHPQYDAAAIAAQQAFASVQGMGGIHYAGAWLGYGFHEDGLRAGFEAADRVIAAMGW
jgi:uncharacterized protein